MRFQWLQYYKSIWNKIEIIQMGLSQPGNQNIGLINSVELMEN